MTTANSGLTEVHNHIQPVVPGEPQFGPLNEQPPTSEPHQPATRNKSFHAAKIMIVDDVAINIKLARKYLTMEGYTNFVTCSDPTQVVDLVHREQPDAMLLDIMMPEVSGLEILEELRADETWTHLPVIILTASDDEETKVTALELGATDFLGKPVKSVELVPRVRNVLTVKAHHDHLKNYAEQLERQVRERTSELAASRLELIHCLARAAEYRDNDTGRHVIRVGRYSSVIARQLGMSVAVVELLEHAAPLHDMGKIGVPDAILLKPGKLEPGEFATMQEHCEFGKRTFEPLSPDDFHAIRSHTVLGEEIFSARSSPVIEMAGKIALTHHEKWDGSGYPLGLAGEEIPIEGRITAVADVFDALSSKRPYKAAFPVDKCFEILEEGRGTHFDPRVLDAFFACKEEILRIRTQYADAE